MPNMEYGDYYNTFVKPVLTGEMDEYLDAMIDTIQMRRKDMAPKIWEFQVGDTVRIVNCSPKYLNGALAKIVKINRTKVVIKLNDTASSRFTKYTNITTPLTMIEKI